MAEMEEWKNNREFDELSEDEEKVFKALGFNEASRRRFMKGISAASLSLWSSLYFTAEVFANSEKALLKNPVTLLNEIKVSIRVNSTVKPLSLDSGLHYWMRSEKALALRVPKKDVITVNVVHALY